MRKIVKYCISGMLLMSVWDLPLLCGEIEHGKVSGQHDLTVTKDIPADIKVQKGADKGEGCCEEVTKDVELVAASEGLQVLPFIPDVIMVDQDGRSVRIVSDVLKGKITIINFIYTSCKSVCQILTNNFRQLEEGLDRIDGKGDVQLVSISIDPEIDTPPRLQQYASTQRIDLSRWMLLVSNFRSIERLSRALGFSNVDKATHAPGVVIWDDIDKRWQRFAGITPTHILMKEISNLPAMVRE